MKTNTDKKPETEDSNGIVEVVTWSLAIGLIVIPFAILFFGLYALKADTWIKIMTGVVIGGIYIYVYQYFFLESFGPDEVSTQYLFGGKPGKTFTGEERPLRLKFGSIISNDRDGIEERPPLVSEIKDAMTSNPESTDWIDRVRDEPKFITDDLHRSTECELMITVLYGLSPEHHVVYNRRLGSPEKMAERIKAEAVSLARSLASTVTTVMLLDPIYLAHIRKQFEEKLREFMLNWGIKIFNATIEVKVSEKITNAITEVGQKQIGKKTAEAEAEITNIKAATEKNASILKSEGEAIATENKAKAEANASKILNDMKIENVTKLGELPEESKKILYLETARDILKDNTKIICDSKSLVGTLQTVADGIEKKGDDHA